MHPFVLFYIFFSIFSAAASVAADRTEIIANQDKRMSYSGNWKEVSLRVIHA
jgi:P pilus assembly chaperone PapD